MQVAVTAAAQGRVGGVAAHIVTVVPAAFALGGGRGGDAGAGFAVGGGFGQAGGRGDEDELQVVAQVLQGGQQFAAGRHGQVHIGLQRGPHLAGRAQGFDLLVDHFTGGADAVPLVEQGGLGGAEVPVGVD